MVGDKFGDQIFMQDGASSYTAKQTIELLKKYFGEKIISIKSEDIWPRIPPTSNHAITFCDGF